MLFKLPHLVTNVFIQCVLKRVALKITFDFRGYGNIHLISKNCECETLTYRELLTLLAGQITKIHFVYKIIYLVKNK